MEKPPKKAEKKRIKKKVSDHTPLTLDPPLKCEITPLFGLRPASKVSEHAPSGLRQALTRETEKVRMEKQKRKRKKK